MAGLLAGWVGWVGGVGGVEGGRRRGGVGQRIASRLLLFQRAHSAAAAVAAHSVLAAARPSCPSPSWTVTCCATCGSVARLTLCLSVFKPALRMTPFIYPVRSRVTPFRRDGVTRDGYTNVIIRSMPFYEDPLFYQTPNSCDCRPLDFYL